MATALSLPDRLAALPDDEIMRLHAAMRMTRDTRRWAQIAETFPPIDADAWRNVAAGQYLPPDSAPILAWRASVIETVEREGIDRAAIIAWYRADRAVEFINHWGITYDPRSAMRKGAVSHPPLLLFKRQRELVEFLIALLRQEEHALIEKSRDMGATWVCCVFSIWLWLTSTAAVGWGSRKEELVDRIGDPDSIFEKIRMALYALPPFLLPHGLSPQDHLVFMKCINPETGATITGECGDNIGRGGRKLIYFKDEAQPLTANILTPFGWRTMGDMVIGSLVIGPDGERRTVTQVKDCGLFPVHRVHFSDGTHADCSPNHLWTVEKAIGKRERLTLRTSEIVETLAYDSPGGQRQYRYRIPICEPVKFGKRGMILPLDPYIVGALLGDGSIHLVPKYRPTFTSADTEIAAEIGRLLPPTCKITKGDRYQYRLGDAEGRRGQGKISRMSLALMEAGIAGFDAPTKHVPDRYKFASPAKRLALLQGLMDTDGSASGGVASFHTCSSRLADDVRFIVQSLGGTATMNLKPDRRGHRDMHVLHIALSMPLFRLPRKLAALKSRKHPPGRTIVRVENLPPQPVRCISVDAEDGLYLTDHCIVTHNSAHYPRPELIEASLGNNTNVQVDFSSVNGLGNVFHRRREAGQVWFPGSPLVSGRANVLVMDWRDHPGKDEVWYQTGRAKAVAEGLLHKFRQENDRDYAASMEGIIILPEWIEAAVDSHIHLDLDDALGPWSAGLDVSDGETGDGNGLAAFEGIVLRVADQWADRDAGVATRRTLDNLADIPCDLQFDSIGVGASVKAEANRLADEGKMPDGIRMIPWNASAKVLDPDEPVIPHDRDSPTNGAMFGNLKAQAWWRIARRFENTYRARMEGIRFETHQLISIDSTIPLLAQVKKELAQPTAKKRLGDGKMIVDKKPEGTTSPNMGDATVMAANPLSGLRPVYPTAVPEFTVAPFAIPAFWPKGFTMKVEAGLTTALWGAYDREQQTLYFITEHSLARGEPSASAQAIRARGDWIPGFIDSDEDKLEARRATAAVYHALGVPVVLAERADEAGIATMRQLLATSRLKVFSTCQSFIRDYRAHRRDEDGKVIGAGLMDCARILCRPLTIQSMIVKPRMDAMGRRLAPGERIDVPVGDRRIGY